MKIINFGSLNIDKVCSVEEFVQPGETIMATGYSVNAGGKGLNQSVAAARAGAQVLHVGAVGSDGLFLKEILRSKQEGTEPYYCQCGNKPHVYRRIYPKCAGKSRSRRFCASAE